MGVGGEEVAVRWKGCIRWRAKGLRCLQGGGGFAGGVKGGVAKGELGEGVEMMVIAVWCAWSVGGVIGACGGGVEGKPPEGKPPSNSM